MRRKFRQRQHTSRWGSQTSDSSAPDDFVLDVLDTPPQSTENEPGTTCNPLVRMSPANSQLIRDLVHYQDLYELPKEEDYKNVQVCYLYIFVTHGVTS